MVQPAVIKVLLVEDDPEDVLLVNELFANEDADRFHLTHTSTMSQACARLGEETFDVLLLDLSLPGHSGLEALAQALELAPGLPVITLVGPVEEGLALSSVNAGAQDYLVKLPGNHMSLPRLRRAMDRHHSQKNVVDLERRDPVTGLLTRHQFREQLATTIDKADPNTPEGTGFTLMLVDLDRFKSINDSLGHQAGDKLLAAVGARLEWNAGPMAQLARLGDDEFAILCPDTHGRDAAENLAMRILEVLEQPFQVEDQEFYITTSIGITCYSPVFDSPELLLRCAESALGRAKESSHHSFQTYEPAMIAPAVERLRLETELRQALGRNEFVLYYQPQVDVISGAIIGIEALLRWHHPKLGLVSPGQFIWLAEETGLIVPIGEWVMRTACAQARAWLDKGLDPMRMVVNLSAQQFKQDNLLDTIREILDETNLPASTLGLEITEGTLMEHSRANDVLLADIKALGLSLSIDDFGTGYSSLSYLKRIPADTLKLDRSFVKDVATNSDDAAIARSIISLAKGLNLQVIAEGVETREQFAFLRDEGCQCIQGYLLGRPLPSRRFESLARRGITMPV